MTLTESNFEEFFAAVGLQLRLGFFDDREAYKRLHGDIWGNREFLFGSQKAAMRIKGFSDFSSNLPADARAALAKSLLNLLKKGINDYNPEELPEAFGIYAKAVRRIADNHNDEKAIVSWFRQLAEIYRDARKPGTCLSLAQVVSSHDAGADGPDVETELGKFLHVMTECAQHYYLREYVRVADKMPAENWKVGAGAEFMSVKEPNFVKSFLTLVDRMNSGQMPAAGKEVRKFTYEYCQNGFSEFSACSNLTAVGKGI